MNFDSKVRQGWIQLLQNDTAFMHHTYYKQRGKNKDSFEKQLQLVSFSLEACGTLASKNEDG